MDGCECAFLGCDHIDCDCGCHWENTCINCGEPSCPGYCDDYQTYNLRPSETGGHP